MGGFLGINKAVIHEENWANHPFKRKLYYCVVCIFRDVDVNIFKSIYKIIMGLNAGKPGILHANNKGADQPVHPRSLISAFVNCLLESKYRNSLRAKF